MLVGFYKKHSWTWEVPERQAREVPEEALEGRMYVCMIYVKHMYGMVDTYPISI
jgi:hypothetical protein